jgi:putative tRNA adenosine deaminase-associated protein
MAGDEGIDFVIAAWCVDAVWQVAAFPAHAGADLAGLVTMLRQLPAEDDALGFVSVDDDFFILVRVRRNDVRMLLSDVTAAAEWLLAREVLDALELPVPADDALDEPRPAGDLALLADLGVPRRVLAELCGDPDLYPDEALGMVAERLGFGAQFERAADRAMQ